LLRNSPTCPTFTILAPSKSYSYTKTLLKISELFGRDEINWPIPLSKLKKEGKDLGVQSFGMAIAFLEDGLIAEKTLKTAKYSTYEPEAASSESHL
jgi:hypothetical protein